MTTQELEEQKELLERLLLDEAFYRAHHTDCLSRLYRINEEILRRNR